MRSFFLWAFLVGCGGTSDKSSDTGTETDTIDESDWWTDGDTDSADDKEEDEGDDDPHVGWMGFYSPSSEWAFLSYSDEGCDLFYSLAVESLEDDCEDCSFSYRFTVMESEIDTVESCPSSVLLDDGTVFGFGQGTTVIYEEADFTMYDLFWSPTGDGGWQNVSGGFSFFTEDDEGEPMWVFGLGPAAPDQSGWLGSFLMSTDEAGMIYTDEGCYLEYFLAPSAVEEDEDCGACQFAYWFTFTLIESERTEISGCPEDAFVEDGEMVGLGHGTTELGFGYYSLVTYDDDSDSWVEVPEGYSYYDGAEGSPWFFGVQVE